MNNENKLPEKLTFNTTGTVAESQLKDLNQITSELRDLSDSIAQWVKSDETN